MPTLCDLDRSWSVSLLADGARLRTLRALSCSLHPGRVTMFRASASPSTADGWAVSVLDLVCCIMRSLMLTLRQDDWLLCLRLVPLCMPICLLSTPLSQFPTDDRYNLSHLALRKRCPCPANFVHHIGDHNQPVSTGPRLSATPPSVSFHCTSQTTVWPSVIVCSSPLFLLYKRLAQRSGHQ